MAYPTDRPATWFVTGASRGLGLELVRQLLQRGDKVAATTRSSQRLLGAMPGIDTTGLLALEVDLADPAAVSAAVSATVERFGHLDGGAGFGGLRGSASFERFDSFLAPLTNVGQ